MLIKAFRTDGAELGPAKNKQTTLLIILLLVAAVLTLYGQVGSHEFINFDDPDYVYANPYVQKGLSITGLSWAFTTTHAANWHPLTWLTHMLVVQIFGLNPAAHHLANVLLHAANAVLLFLLFKALTGRFWPSAIVAALFAFHPLHVESVAWVAELKDLLSTFFGLLTIYLYGRYARAQTRGRYLVTLSCFALGLMAKPMLVTLPVLLLLLDYWPLKRLGADTRSFLLLVREKVPFFALAAASCAVTIHAQAKGDALRSLAESPLSARIGNALVAYVGYLGKTFRPVDLAPLYPFPADVPLWKPVAAGAVLAVITLLVIRTRKRRPYLFVGWFWYLGTLLPVIGILRVGQQAMADRYTYLPLTGIFLLLVFGVVELTAGWRYRRGALLLGTVTLLSLCTLTTWRQLAHWRNNTTLYTHTLAVTHDNYMIHNNFGFALDTEGRLDEALYHYQEALRIAPWYAKAYLNRGITLRKKGQLDDGMVFVRKAIELNPDMAAAHIELGLGMLLKGRPDDAIDYFQMALRIDPELADGHYNMGLAYSELGKSRQAIEQYTRALQLKPADFDCHYYLGVELAKEGRYGEAIAHFAAILQLNPDKEMELMARQGLDRAVRQKGGNP